VTLLVTPRQAQTLQLASQGGRPWLVLRNGGDGGEVEADPTLITDLRVDPGAAGRGGQGFLGMGGWFNAPGQGATDGGAAPATVEPVVARPDVPVRRVTRSVQVIRGGVESEVIVPVPAPRAAPRQELIEGKTLPPGAPNALSSTKD
jgi:hypothetical protein